MTGAALADGGSPFSLPPEAAQWASRVRAFVEQELQPYERHAELNQGRLPDGVAERHERLALELGLSRIDVPREFGGLELSMLTQVAIAEELGRATNALSWCFPEAQAWMFEAFDAAQIDRYALPMTRAERHLCDGMTFTNAWFRRERLMIAARCCGAAGRLIETGLDFARNRLVSGRPIADYQLIQAMLADSAAELHAARLVTREAAAAHDCGLDLKTLHARCSLAKLNASEMAWRVADRIVQIFGGRGYMRENVAERYLRELRVDRIWEGTSEIQRLIIARALLKRGLDSVIG
jgi:alkylation response protein AidB-like acyl-CoA dehydrogenase